MNHRVSAVVLCLVIGAVSPRPASAESRDAAALPVVESAALPPTFVNLGAAPGPDTYLRLQDPSRGGALLAGSEGLAYLVGPAEEGLFVVRIGIEFLEADTSVELRVIDPDGAQLNSIVLSSAVPARWGGNLCEMQPSPKQAGRVELFVRSGRAIATAYRGGPEYVTVVPILSRAVVTAGGGTSAFSTSAFRLPGTSAPSALSVVPLTTGQSQYYGSYNWPGTSFVFNVYGGPPNTCGDIHTLRNGSWVVSNGWICTDSMGSVTKGPWNVTSSYPGQNQTDSPTYIQWPDGTVTTDSWHVIDTVHPTISIAPNTAVRGTANAAQFGSGFNTQWTSIETAFQEDAPYGLWWNSTNCPAPGIYCYTSGSPVFYPAVITTTLDNDPSDAPQWPAGFGLTWQAGVFPERVGHTYSVLVQIHDQWGIATQTAVLP